MKTVFITGNQYKFQVAQKAVKNLDIKLIQKDIKTPEIQNIDVEETASFSGSLFKKDGFDEFSDSWWLGDRDSNPDTQVQNLMSYH